MLTRRPAPRAVLWFQGRALTFPGVASQAHQLLGQATYLNPGRKALTVTGLPQVKTAHSESQDRESSDPRCLSHASPGGLPRGAWPHSLTVLSKEGLREMQPLMVRAEDGEISVRGGDRPGSSQQLQGPLW